jgi:hypothetical protein
MGRVKLTEFFDQDIEPKALCRNCEYFDGGGLKQNGDPLCDHGDCVNPRSDRLQTTADDGCKYFFPCSTRWPEADHG